jgi:hypothetical protein
VRYPFSRVSGYKRRSDIKEVDIRGPRVYRCACEFELGLDSSNESSPT